jgi:hypothetical protein
VHTHKHDYVLCVDFIFCRLVKQGKAGPAGLGVDVIPCFRRILLDQSISMFIGPAVLGAAHDAFVEEFITFQDALEEATAKSVVLPPGGCFETT